MSNKIIETINNIRVKPISLGKNVSSNNDLSNAQILDIVNSKISTERQERLSELLFKNREVGLNEAEEKELDLIMETSESLNLAKSEALKIAVERGLIPPLS